MAKLLRSNWKTPSRSENIVCVCVCVCIEYMPLMDSKIRLCTVYIWCEGNATTLKLVSVLVCYLRFNVIRRVFWQAQISIEKESIKENQKDCFCWQTRSLGLLYYTDNSLFFYLFLPEHVNFVAANTVLRIIRAGVAWFVQWLGCGLDVRGIVDRLSARTE